jgi:formate hydrogenlyase subunit 3/multisubunit Na+/H+ antiporter MnhD subunit
MEISWLLLGVSLELDQTGLLLLSSSALIWLFAAVYALLNEATALYNGRFRLFFLLSMAGNMLLILAADMMSFYCGFALMGLAAYGMVVQRHSQRARRAGRVYLGWTLVGELALFSAIALLSADIGSKQFSDLTQYEYPAIVVTLLVIGFGIKMALPGLHFWLPMTYAAAPAAAAAALSGPMITAGLLGWLRFLPAGADGLLDWANTLQWLGLIGIVLGTLLGLLQRDPRAVLGCSSILKMGVITAVFGSALAYPQAAPGILAALMLYALHHLLVKAALFLGVGEWQRAGSSPWLLAGLALLALALLGSPLSGGAGAKAELKMAAAEVATAIGPLLLFSALATALLLGRFFWLITRRSQSPTNSSIQRSTLAWLLLVPLAFVLPLNPLSASLDMTALLTLLVGFGILAVAWAIQVRRPTAVHRKVSMPILRRLRSFRSAQRIRAVSGGLKLPLPPWRPSHGDQPILPLATAGLLWLLLFILLLVLVVNG